MMLLPLPNFTERTSDGLVLIYANVTGNPLIDPYIEYVIACHPMIKNCTVNQVRKSLY